MDALDIADVAGRDSLLWQQNVIRNGMAKRADGRWAAYEVGVLVSRQNGKNGAIEVVELGWMMNEPGVSILHTAHEFQTALESLDKLEQLIRSHPLLENEIASVRHSNGKESILMKNGSIIRFRTRTKSGGRGFSVDRLVIDEAMIWSPASQAAIMPLLTTAQNPQIWYLGSAADAAEHEHCGKWSSLRDRALEGDDPRLCWMEWSAPDPPEDISLRQEWREDRDHWASANPSMGYLLTEDYVIGEMNALRRDIDKWEIERLSAGRWPVEADDVVHVPVIDEELWESRADSAPRLVADCALGLDMAPDRSTVTISAVTRRADGGRHLEVVFHGGGSGVVDLVKRINAAQSPRTVVIARDSPAASLVPELEAAGVPVTLVSVAQMAQQCGAMVDDLEAGTLSHTGDPLFDQALDVAVAKDVGKAGAWVWDRAGDEPVTQLTAGTLALVGIWVETDEPESVSAYEDDDAEFVML